MPKNHGFTLVELMIVISILAVLAAISAPGLLSWMAGYRAGSAAREIFSVVQQARFRAVKENAHVVVVFDPPGNSYRAFLDNGVGANAENNVQDPDEVTLFSGSMPVRVNLYEAKFGANSFFYFNSKGLPSGFGHVSVQGKADDFKQITVSITGSARIKRSRDGTNWY